MTSQKGRLLRVARSAWRTGSGLGQFVGGPLAGDGKDDERGNDGGQSQNHADGGVEQLGDR